MKARGLTIIGLLISLALTIAPPAVFAVTPSLGWTPNPNPVPGSTEHGTANVQLDTVLPDCPAGDTYSGQVTVNSPITGLTIGALLVGPSPCGTAVTFDFPGDFTGGSTLVCGTYNTEFLGSTSPAGATFDVKNTFKVQNCATSVPEFTVPTLILAALGMVVLAAARRGRLLKL